MNKKKVVKKEQGQVTRGVRINTPPIQVEIQSTDGGDTLENIIKMAEGIIQKHTKKEESHR
jgi:DNA-binding HxlR family transcriptional regulator